MASPPPTHLPPHPSALRSTLRLTAKTLVLLAPFLWAALLVGRYGVDVPYTDQWTGEYPLFEKMSHGTLGLGDFFAQHNEHRIFFPRLIFYALARLTHWNVRAELWLILGLSAFIFFNVWQTLRATGWRCAGPGFWLLLAAGVLIFSPLHRENQLWGFQIGFLLPLACLTACPWVSRSPSVRARFLGTFALSVVCSFSIGGGFLCWAFCFPLLVQAGGARTWTLHRRWWLVWTTGFAGSVALYLHGYHVPPTRTDRWLFLHDPVLAVKYWLTYLGLPFAFGTPWDPFLVSQASAVVMLSVLLAALLYLWRSRADAILLELCLPWLVFTSIALAYAALTALGRIELGLWQALTSRYVIFAVLLPIGLSFLLATIYRHRRSHPKITSPSLVPGTPPSRPTGARLVGAVLLAFGLTLGFLHLSGSVKIAAGWQAFNFSLLRSKALVATVAVVDEPDLLSRLVYHSPLRPKIILLDQLGFLRPPLVKSRDLGAIADLSQPPAESRGKLEQVVRGPDGRLGMRGWAVLPGKARPADAVLLSCDDASGHPILFALAEVGLPRPEVSGARRQAACLRCGWQKLFPSTRLPSNTGLLKAWSFDAETSRASLLPGQAPVPN